MSEARFPAQYGHPETMHTAWAFRGAITGRGKDLGSAEEKTQAGDASHRPEKVRSLVQDIGC